MIKTSSFCDHVVITGVFYDAFRRYSIDFS